MDYFATCPKGFESLLASEMRDLGIHKPRPLQGQVSFSGQLRDAYLLCLWSRMASRVVAILGRFDATDANALYSGTSAISWEDHVLPDATFAVDASGTNAKLKDTRYTALRVKDAIADRLAQLGRHAITDPKNANLRVVVRISRNHATVGIDLSGLPLFAREHGKKTSQRGLRADYANALLRLGGWSHEQEPKQTPLVAMGQYPDVLIVEAALTSAHYAPGLMRRHWGFDGWAMHNSKVWDSLVKEAKDRMNPDAELPLAYRSFAKGTSRAKIMLRTLGINANVVPLSSFIEKKLGKTPTLIADLSDVRADEIMREASWLQELLRAARALEPARTAVAARNMLPEAYLAQPCDESLHSIRGRDELLLISFGPYAPSDDQCKVVLNQNTVVSTLVPGSEQFAARLKKVAKARAKWARRQDVSCYRVYDADLPDYAVSLDLFEGLDPKAATPDGTRWLQIYEYAAPKSVDPTLAQSRLMDVLAIAPKVLNVPPNNTFLRVRRRDKGGSQYASEAKAPRMYSRTTRRGEVELPPGAHLIDEGGLTFEVNFSSRLDCGIFLDHRETRAMLREMAKQTKGSKRFLNLFAYTGTATCYAADGGMRYTTTVDLSRPSLDWARRNMARNGFEGKEHEFVQADVVSWVQEQRHTKNRWDLVFCDVPTFSNSSRMGRRSFDVQRDHVELLIGVSRLLTKSGSCVFSCNLRSFKPNEAALAKAGVRIHDITEQTIPEDFARNKRIHHAFVVTRER